MRKLKKKKEKNNEKKKWKNTLLSSFAKKIQYLDDCLLT